MRVRRSLALAVGAVALAGCGSAPMSQQHAEPPAGCAKVTGAELTLIKQAAKPRFRDNAGVLATDHSVVSAFAYPIPRALRTDGLTTFVTVVETQTTHDPMFGAQQASQLSQFATNGAGRRLYPLPLGGQAAYAFTTTPPPAEVVRWARSTPVYRASKRAGACAPVPAG